MVRHVLSLLRRSPALASMAAAFLVAGAGLAVAAGSDTTIHACVKKGNGALRVVDAAKDCRRSERAIAFDERGPRGLTGATGAQGPAGPQGPPGPQGPAGKDAPTAAAPHQAVIGTARLTFSDDSELAFDVTGLETGLSAPSSGSQSTGAGAGKVTLKPIVITKRVDGASPTLLKAVTSGRSASLTVDLQRPGASSPYRRYTSNLVLISKLHQDAPDAGGHPIETVTFAAGGLDAEAPVDAPSAGDAIGRITFHPDDDPADDIESVPVYGFSAGVSQSSTIGSSSGGAGAGKATFEDITIRTGLDAASRPLALAVGSGTPWRAATLVLDGGATYELGGVAVTSLTDTATGETPTTPVVEQITMRAGSIAQSAGGDTACWDTTRNTTCGG